MSPYYHIMPVDKSTIRTRVTCHPGLLADPAVFLQERNLPIRSAKPSTGGRGGSATKNITLNVLAYKGINVELSKIVGDPLADVTIKFNPGVCLYGHNSRILLLTEFLHALSLMANSLKPLLLDQDHWVDLVPGLRPEGVAYWSYLEVLLQLRDACGKLLPWFRHLRHPSITTPSRHWPESISVGPHKGKLRLSIYLKAAEQYARGNLSESEFQDAGDVLRLEARMKDEKLVHYLGSAANVEVIAGKPRLVRFYPGDLVRGHRACFGELQGVFSDDAGPLESEQGGQLSSIGQLLARVASDHRSTKTFPQLLAAVRHYMGAADDTIGKIRKAGLAELSRLSPVSRDTLLSDAAYQRQLGIASGQLERLVSHEVDDLFVDPLINTAYRPVGQPFLPHVELPTYHR
jgi:hypothetical protein